MCSFRSVYRSRCLSLGLFICRLPYGSGQRGGASWVLPFCIGVFKGVRGFQVVQQEAWVSYAVLATGGVSDFQLRGLRW